MMMMMTPSRNLFQQVQPSHDFKAWRYLRLTTIISFPSLPLSLAFPHLSLFLSLSLNDVTFDFFKRFGLLSFFPQQRPSFFLNVTE